MPEQCSYEGCPRPVYRDGRYPNENKCIFHSEGKDPQMFRDALAKQIREWRNTKAEMWDFRGWVFVDIERERDGDYEWERYNLFRRAVFPVGADFSRATFSGDAVFVLAVFSEIALFTSATFSGFASFVEAVFSRTVWFDSGNFSKDASFDSAIFSGGVLSNKVTFSGHASFTEAVFSITLHLPYCSFAVLGDFTNAVIRGKLGLEWPGEGLRRDDKGEKTERGRLLLKDLFFEKGVHGQAPVFDLRKNSLQADCKLCIHETQMERVLLEGTDCREIEFYDVHWPHWRKWPRWRRWLGWKESENWCEGGRRVVGDEYAARMQEDPKAEWSLIAVTYQQLTDRYRRDLNHPVANDFERGIFEARLMASKQKNENGKRDWRNMSLLYLYKGASNFGGSIARPVWIMLGLLVLCAAFYGTIIHGGRFAWPCDFRLVWDSIVAALRVVSLDRGWFSREVDTNVASSFARLVVSGVAVLQTALTATLITLFIFAIRRRFKHSE